MAEQMAKPDYVIFQSNADLDTGPIGFGYQAQKDDQVTIILDRMTGDGKFTCVKVVKIRKPN